ncbi:MAG: ParB/RepB/Spo0J family partition protein [Candidatus Glassbacteria bacterium]
MTRTVELSRLDLRYEGYRLRDRRSETKLLGSIASDGIRHPLEGVDVDERHVLLNGFKRYRCARKLGIQIVPYMSLGADIACGIIELLRIANMRSLTILEQALMIDELKRKYNMTVREIADDLGRSSAWVSVRMGMIGEMSPYVREQVFSGSFPVYSYMYTLRQFMRLKDVRRKDVDEFVSLVSPHKLSTRDIEKLANGYFRGSEEFRRQLRNGDISWGLEALSREPLPPDGCNTAEYGMLKDLEITQKYMQRLVNNRNNHRFKTHAFYAQANLLAGGIMGILPLFTRVMKEIYDRSGKEKGDLPVARGRSESAQDQS